MTSFEKTQQNGRRIIRCKNIRSGWARLRCCRTTRYIFPYKIRQVGSEGEHLSASFVDKNISSTYSGDDDQDPRTNRDILCSVRPTFLKGYKNPCFISNLNGKTELACLPYFQLIGVDKSATSDLFNRITKHPDIFPNEGIAGKETQWWSWKRYGMNLFSPPSSPVQPLADYLRYFQPLAKVLGNDKNSQMKKVYITGDGSPMDMWDFRGWTQIPQNGGLHEPGYLTPHLIRNINPHSKFIIIFRNPVDRLLSDYHFLGIGERTPKAFHGNVLKAISVLKECEIESTRRRCLFNSSMHIDWAFSARIHIGFYSTYLKEWLSVFPRDQFLILRIEDYSNNGTSSMERVFQFLAVGNLSQEEKVAILESDKSKRKRKRNMEMLDETKRILEQLYEPSLRELAQILKDQSFAWLPSVG